MANAASLPYLERVGPVYVASVITAFNALAEAPADDQPDAEAEHSRLAAAAVLPLTELLAARGPLEHILVVDWMLGAGAGQN